MTPATVVKTGNIIEMALAEGTLGTFISALQQTGLLEQLVGRRSHTVFAPTDDAFKDYNSKTLAELFADRQALTTLMAYHIVPGIFKSSYFNSRMAIRTLLGRELVIDRSFFLTPDIECSNGIIDVIDRVLVPG